MFKRPKKNSISVSLLSRYWDNPDTFENFINSPGNKIAISKGNDFHNKAMYNRAPKWILITLIIGVFYVVFTAFYYSLF
jgi:hypothetical protein